MFLLVFTQKYPVVDGIQKMWRLSILSREVVKGICQENLTIAVWLGTRVHTSPHANLNFTHAYSYSYSPLYTTNIHAVLVMYAWFSTGYLSIFVALNPYSLRIREVIVKTIRTKA